MSKSKNVKRMKLLKKKKEEKNMGVFHECQFHRYFLNFKMLIYKGKLQF